MLKIITDRLQLKLSEAADATDLYRLRTHPEVNKYIKRESKKTISDIEEFIINVNLDLDKIVFFTIYTLKNPAFAGTICLWNINKADKYAEVGYDLLPAFQGQGIMSNAMQAVLNFGFTNLHLDDIEAYTHKENIRSRRLLEKFSFKLIDDKIDSDNLSNVVYALKTDKLPKK